MSSLQHSCCCSLISSAPLLHCTYWRPLISRYGSQLDKRFGLQLTPVVRVSSWYFFVPMSTIDDSWLSFVPPPVARGRLGYARSATTGRGRSEALWLAARTQKRWAILGCFSFDVCHVTAGALRTQKPPLTTWVRSIAGTWVLHSEAQGRWPV